MNFKQIEMKTIIGHSRKYGNKNILVDDNDFEYLNQFNWTIVKDRNMFYAVRTFKLKGKNVTLRMHREILNLTNPKKNWRSQRW